MRKILYRLIDFKEIHPIRFWFFIIILIFIIVALAYIIIKKSNSKESISLDSETKINQTILQAFYTKNKVLFAVIAGQFILVALLIIAYFNKNETYNNLIENPSISSSKYIFGIDISHYQGKINWSEMRTSHHPIKYIFIRSTMGVNGQDIRFEENWLRAKKHNYIRGAYHYYRPNENSTRQFENFKSVVNLEKGDFIPVLDIEKESRFGRDNLRSGVLNWLKLAEIEYGRKPIIYTGLNFYKHILKGNVDDYPLWIAAYSGKHRLKNVEWDFHQFTEKVIIKGVKTTVDGNDFRQDSTALNKLRIRK